MADDWRTSEPEVGQLARVRLREYFWLIAEFVETNGKLFWRNGSALIPSSDVESWQPITTPEELRLRKEVEDLRHAVDCDLEHVEAYRLVQAENDKFRAEVERLRRFRGKIEAAFNSEDGAYDYSGKVTDAIIELKEEEQEGGWDVRE